MALHYKELRRENGWEFIENRSWEDRRISSHFHRMKSGCVYFNVHTSMRLFQWNFDDRGRASHEVFFSSELEMERFFDPYFGKRPLCCMSAKEITLTSR
jgi:hypothetical protein